MGRTSKSGGSDGSVTPSTALLNQKLATLSAPRMLTASEIALLRQSMLEIAEWFADERRVIANPPG